MATKALADFVAGLRYEDLPQPVVVDGPGDAVGERRRQQAGQRPQACQDGSGHRPVRRARLCCAAPPTLPMLAPVRHDPSPTSVWSRMSPARDRRG